MTTEPDHATSAAWRELEAEEPDVHAVLRSIDTSLRRENGFLNLITEPVVPGGKTIEIGWGAPCRWFALRVARSPEESTDDPDWFEIPVLLQAGVVEAIWWHGSRTERVRLDPSQTTQFDETIREIADHVLPHLIPAKEPE